MVLLGPTGAGKTTTLRLIAGLEDTTSGTIEIDGKDATALPPAKRGLAMVFQSYALYPHMTVRDNMEFGLEMAGMAKAERRSTVEAAARTLRLTDGTIVQDTGSKTPRVLSFTRHDLPIDLPAVERFRARGDEQREYILPELLRIGWGGEAETRTEQAGSQARTGRRTARGPNRATRRSTKAASEVPWPSAAALGEALPWPGAAHQGQESVHILRTVRPKIVRTK